MSDAFWSSWVDRRTFLQRAAASAGTAAVAMLPRFSAEAPAGMYVTLMPSTARGAQWPELAHIAARAGYAGVDFNFPSLVSEGPQAVRALMTELRLKPGISNLGFQPLAAQAQFEAGLAALDQNARFIAEIGCDRAWYAVPSRTPAGMSYADYWAFCKTRATQIAAVLYRYQIALGLEFFGLQCLWEGTCTIGGNRGAGPVGPAGGMAAGAAAVGATSAATGPRVPFIHSLNDMMKLAIECGPNVGVILDIWHWHHSGSTVADVLQCDRSRIVHTHLSDTKEMPSADVRDDMRLLAGEGVIDYKGFLGALKQIGYTGGVAPEPLGRFTMDVPPEQAAKLAFTTTWASMQEAGVA